MEKNITKPNIMFLSTRLRTINSFYFITISANILYLRPLNNSGSQRVRPFVSRDYYSQGTNGNSIYQPNFMFNVYNLQIK